MSDQPQSVAPTPGIDFSSATGQKLSVSEHTADHILASLERIADHFFSWSHDNPFLFIIFVAGLLAAFFIWQRSKIDVERMKQEYNDRRSATKTQLPLPFPSTPPESEPGKK